MNESTVEIDQIEVTVSGLFRTQHHFETPAGSWGELSYAAVAERATFAGADGRELAMERTSWLRGKYDLREGGTVLASSWRRSAFRRVMDIEFHGQSFSLEPEGFVGRSWRLVDAAGMSLLGVSPRGLVRRGANLTINGPVAADLIVFTYYLVYTHQREEASHVAATAGASS